MRENVCVSVSPFRDRHALSAVFCLQEHTERDRLQLFAVLNGCESASVRTCLILLKKKKFPIFIQCTLKL